MDAGIILGGQQPDILGAMDKGRAMAESQIGLNRQNALAELYRTQGAQIAAGDQNALNALAGFDPNASLGVQGNILGIQAQKQNMAFSAEEMQMKRDAAKASAAASLQEQAATLTKEQLAQEQQALSEALSGAAFFYQNKDKAGYDAFLTSKGLDPAEFPFEAFPAHAATVEGVLEAMKAFEPAEAPSPIDGAPKGYMFNDPANPAAGVAPLPGYTPTPDTVVNNNMGEGDKFYEELDKKAAAMFDTLQTEGIQAGRTLGLINRLDEVIKATPTGGWAAVTQAAGEWGIDLGGLDEVQGVQALINQIVPQQRQPGSGPMSDADLALFKQSVPRLINQPGGNQIIIETMRGISQYVMQQAEIADAVANREITPAEGRKALRALKNPLENFAVPKGDAAPAGTGKAAEMSDEDFLKAMGLE